MKIIISLILTLLLQPLQNWGQSKQDSLLQLVKNANNTADFETLISASSSFSESDPVAGAQLSEAIWKHADQQDLAPIISESLIWWGNSLLNQSKYDSAIVVLTKAQDNFSPGSDPLIFAKMELFKGVSHYYLGDYRLASSELLTALKEESLKDDPVFHARVLRTLGEIYRAADNLNPSLDYLQKALEQSKLVGDSLGVAVALNRLGVVYYQKAEHEISEKLLIRSLEISRANQMENVISMNLNDLGELYYATKEYGKCIELYQMALERNSDPDAYINTLNNIARLDWELKKYDEAISRAKEALEQAEAINILTYKVDASKIIADSYHSNGDYLNATKYYNLYIDYREQLFEEEQNRQIMELETQYQTQQKELEIARLTEREIAERKSKSLYLGGLIISFVFLSILVLLFLQIRKNNKYIQSQNVQLEELNSTKDKFFSIIAHDLRSPMVALQGVGQKLEYFLKRNKQDKLLEMGEKIDTSIDRLNHLLNNLLNWAVSQSGAIPHNPSMLQTKSLIGEIVALYINMAEVKHIEIQADIKNLPIYADQNTASTVIRNILSNAIKFTKEGGKVTISTAQNGIYTSIHIKDEGNGMDKHTLAQLFELKKSSEVGTYEEKGFGLGLKLCKEFVEINNGFIEVDSTLNRGSVFTINFPQQPAGKIKQLSVA